MVERSELLAQAAAEVYGPTAVTDLDPFAPQLGSFSGDKFLGGFGPTQLWQLDYWTLRQRSAQLFTENLYARGLIRRLITNEVNTGLSLEALPDGGILGIPEDTLDDWAETVENRFTIWGQNPALCDHQEAQTFGAIQEAVRQESLIEGDILVILRQSQAKLPTVQLVSGSKVATPIDARPRAGNRIVEGVELDRRGRQVAFWVTRDDGERGERVPAYGPKSGRRVAWLVYGTDKRHHEVRGQPLLALVLQSLKEIDRYRDSAQRKAVINSVLALVVEKEANTPGSRPLTGGAVRRDEVTTTSSDGSTRTRKLDGHVPGLIVDELNQGEKIKGFPATGTDEKFGEFEEAIIQAIAWAHEIPPEILRLAFSNNYSASQAAINEFRMYLNRVRARFGEAFCQPVYVDWLLSEALLRKISARGLLDSWRNPEEYDLFGAWVGSDWSGAIKPSTDMVKQAKGYKWLVDEGWITNDRTARELTGTKFSKNMKRLKRENQKKVEAARPLADFRAEYGDKAADDAMAAVLGALEELPGEVAEAVADTSS